MTEQIANYLLTHDAIVCNVKEEELQEGRTGRYLELLDAVNAEPMFLAKFCGKFKLTFALPEETMWTDERARAFVRQLIERYDTLFFLAERGGITLRLLAILGCAGTEMQGDNFVLDEERFNALLYNQFTGIVRIAQWLRVNPFEAERLIDSIYAYFGIAKE